MWLQRMEKKHRTAKREKNFFHTFYIFEKKNFSHIFRNMNFICNFSYARKNYTFAYTQGFASVEDGGERKRSCATSRKIVED